MKELQLIEILKTFDKEELKSLKKFLKSPFVNSRRNLVILIDHLTFFHPEFDSPKLNREFVFKKIFENEEFNEKKIMNFVFDLTEAVKDFLMHISLEKDDIDADLYTSKGLFNKNILGLSNKILQKAESKLVPGFSTKKDFFTKKRKILSLKNAYHTANNDVKGISENQNELNELTAVQFLIEYTWMMCSNVTTTHTLYKKNNNSVIESIGESIDIEKLLKLTDNFNEIYRSLIPLHIQIIKTITEPENTKNYYLLKKIFYKNISYYDKEEKFHIFSHLINYCGENIKNYDGEFSKEMLDVYKGMLKNNCYTILDKEFLSILDYRNIMMLCRIHEDIKFFEFFLKEYIVLLEPDMQNEAGSLTKAQIFFMKNEFKKAHENISKIKNENYIFKIDIKNLKLKICYELNYIEEAFLIVDSYNHFLTTSKEITESKKKNNLNFLKAFNYLLQVKSGKTGDVFIKLKNEIDSLENISKKWFLLKVKELKNFEK